MFVLNPLKPASASQYVLMLLNSLSLSPAQALLCFWWALVAFSDDLVSVMLSSLTSTSAFCACRLCCHLLRQHPLHMLHPKLLLVTGTCNHGMGSLQEMCCVQPSSNDRKNIRHPLSPYVAETSHGETFKELVDTQICVFVTWHKAAPKTPATGTPLWQ